MVERKLNSFLAEQSARKLINAEDIEIYKYGYTLVMESGINILITAIIGIITGWLPYMLLFLLLFMPLRTYCGGYHAASFVRCTILSNLVILAAVAIIVLWNPNIAALIIMECIGIGIILLKAPCQCPNKPISSGEARKYGKIIKVILVIQIAIALIVFFCDFNEKILDLIVMAHFIVGMGVFIGRWKEIKF